MTGAIRRTSSQYTILVWFLFVTFVLDIFEAPIPYEIYSFGTTFICLLFIVMNINLFEQKAILYLGSFIFIILFSAVVKMSGLEDMCKIITFLSVLMMSTKFKINTRTLKYIYLLFIILGVLIFLFAPHGDLSILIQSKSKFLQKVNPNTSAFYMLMMTLVNVVFVIYSNGLKRILYVILACLSTVGILIFESRNCLLCLIVALAFMLLFRFIKGNKKTRFVALICVGAILFAYLYSITLYNAVGGTGQVTIFGKDLFTGRQKIWQSAFSRLEGHYLFGIGNTLAEGSENGVSTYNVHNQFLSILTVYGLPTVIAFILCFTKFTNALANEKTQYYIMLSISICIVLGCYFESYFQMFRSLVCELMIFILVIGIFEKGDKNVKRDSPGV